MKSTLTIAATLLLAVALAGCDMIPGMGQEPQQPLPMTAAPPASPLPNAVPTPAQPQMPVAPPAPVAPAAPAAPAEVINVPPYQWTEAPTFETIPDVAAAGMANTRPMAVKTVVIEPSMDKWRMKISDKELDSPTSILMGGQSVNIDLPGTPAAGTQWTREMEYGDGYFQIGTDANNPEATTSWNADNAWVIEFTKWDVADYDTDGDLFQEAGKASGRFAVCYKGSATGIQNSWVAGTFEDAIVRYMGKPQWLEDGDKAPASDTPKTSGEKKKTAKEPGKTTPPAPAKDEPAPAKDKPEKDKKKDDGTITIDKEKAQEALDAAKNRFKKLTGKKKKDD